MFLTLYKDPSRGRGGAGRPVSEHGAARGDGAGLPVRGDGGGLLVRPLDAGQPAVESRGLRHCPGRGGLSRPERHCLACRNRQVGVGEH